MGAHATGSGKAIHIIESSQKSYTKRHQISKLIHYSQLCAADPHSKSHFLCSAIQLPVASDRSWRPTPREPEVLPSPKKSTQVVNYTTRQKCRRVGISVITCFITTADITLQWLHCNITCTTEPTSANRPWYWYKQIQHTRFSMGVRLLYTCGTFSQCHNVINTKLKAKAQYLI